MHMADALVSPAVGGALWAGAAGVVVYCSKRVKEDPDDRKAPLMGVMGAFVFAAQMINFAIPGTGSSGHLGGGLILAILLGPHAAFLTMASVLTIQALFFADGGLLALGCNLFNMGFFPCFAAYPLYKKITGETPSEARLCTAAVIAAVVGLQLGAFSVVLQTMLSEISELPFFPFLLLMQPIHLAIGVVEGAATAAVVLFVLRARPELVGGRTGPMPIRKANARRVLMGFLIATMIIGGALSWFASSHPDGLEWAMLKTAGKAEFKSSTQGVGATLADIQNKTSFLPDYGFKAEETASNDKDFEPRPTVNPGATVSGLVGGAITLAIAGLIGYALSRRRKQGIRA